MSRAKDRTSQIASAWVNRTPSGLPLCSICHKEYGFCPHSPMITRERARSMSMERGVPIPKNAEARASIPNAIMMYEMCNKARQSAVGTELEHHPRRGVKRRSSVTREDRSGQKKRRGEGKEIKESVAESTSTKGKNKKSGKHTPYRSSRFEDSPVGSARKGKERHAPGDGGRGQHLDCGGGSGGGSASRSESSCDGDDADGHELLRFPGIRLNVGGQECLACYHAARIMVSFECEKRAWRKPEVDGTIAGEGGQGSVRRLSGTAQGRTDRSTSGAGAPRFPFPSARHAMCLDCFRVFVESRVRERKLVTSRDVQGYTVGCPMGCADSFIDPACFEEVLGAKFMVKYRRFSAIHLASHMRVVWCPGCHCGVVPAAAAAAAAATASRQAQLNPMPPPSSPEQSASSLWGVVRWARSTAAPASAAAGAEGAVTAARDAAGGRSGRQGKCIGCPGCQASLCMSCGALHEPGVTCDDAALQAERLLATANEVKDDPGQEGSGSGDGAGIDGGDGKRRDIRASVGASSAAMDRRASLAGGLPSASTKRCPRCGVPIFKDGGCNHMTCSMCEYEFCWLDLAEWVVGGACQRGHWSDEPALNHAYNIRQAAAMGFRESCIIF